MLDSIILAGMSKAKSSYAPAVRGADWPPHGAERGLASGHRLARIPPRLPAKGTHKARLYLIVETDDISVLRLIRAALPPGCRLRVHCADAAAGAAAAPADIVHSYPAPDSRPALTARQREVLDFLLAGLSNKAIARKLGLSHFTVRNHVSQLMRLLGVATRKEAVARFAGRGVNG